MHHLNSYAWLNTILFTSYLSLYATIVTLSVLFGAIGYVVFVVGMVRASRIIHRTLVNTVLSSTLRCVKQISLITVLIVRYQVVGQDSFIMNYQPLYPGYLSWYVMMQYQNQQPVLMYRLVQSAPRWPVVSIIWSK